MKAHNKRLAGPRTKVLYDLGFAIHWVKPKSKRPVELGWASGPRKTWSGLIKSYTRGMNVGVRLGSASKIGDQFLAVIDCDVKSTDPAHTAEMEAKLGSLLGELANSSPVVLSGRGNGSKHVYVLTEAPASAQRLAQSSEKVKVFMPSSERASAQELKELAPEEIKKGMRLRAAWEIAVMGDGQQVVLPPSIHPDSGESYTWLRPITHPSDLKLFKFDQKVKTSKKENSAPFTEVEVDLVTSKLSNVTYEMIVNGEGVSDRSAALLGVTNKMLKAGFTDDEILTVLTDPDNYLGAVAYEHAQTEDRARAANWLRRYTLEKSKRETLAESVFQDEVVEEEPLSPEAAASQLEELIGGEKDWRDLIERGSVESGCKPKNTLKNVIMILKGEGGDDVFKRDEFANAELYGRVAPWGSQVGAEVSDLDTVRIKSWLADNYRFEPSNDRIGEAISKIADQNRFHPVREYLDSLVWDGVPRIDNWLKTYMEASAEEPYLSAVSRKTLCAMVGRIYRPGIKFDHVLILENEKQGVGKSTSVRMLAGDKWFSDATINIGDKDAVLTMRSIWVVELGELSGMRKADVDQLKEFVSRTTDRIRVPYGKRTENFPRQCIFIGTTNSKEYLKDPTGNRRFWPVSVGACDFKAIERDRDQLLAEAKFAYDLGEPLYLENSEMIEASLVEQEARAIQDPLEEVLSDWLNEKVKERKEGDDDLGPFIDRKQFRTSDLFSITGPLHGKNMTAAESARVIPLLRKMGFTSVVKWNAEKKISQRFWSPLAPRGGDL